MFISKIYPKFSNSWEKWIFLQIFFSFCTRVWSPDEARELEIESMFGVPANIYNLKSLAVLISHLWRGFSFLRGNRATKARNLPANVLDVLGHSGKKGGTSGRRLIKWFKKPLITRALCAVYGIGRKRSECWAKMGSQPKETRNLRGF